MEIDIKKLGINGEGIGYYNKKPIFVIGALPGEKVDIDIIDDNIRYSNAKLNKVISKSDKREKPFCPYYEDCGGCSIQHLNYEESLKLKRDIVIESIKKYTRINPYSFEIKKMIPSSMQKAYRNKSSLRVKNSLMGIYKINTNDLVCIDDCPIHNNEINIVNKKIVELMKKYDIKGYNQKNKSGCIRYVVTRIAVATNEIQVTLILGAQCEIKKFLEEIFNIQNVVSVYTDFNNIKKTKEIFGRKLRLEYGKERITERLMKFSFSLLPNAFFQLNPTQTIRLYDEVKKAAKLSGKEKVLDAFCGVGTIGIWAANNALKVLGIDSNKEAIKNARENADINKINNIEFLSADISIALTEENKFDPDVIIVDPPRVGLGDFTEILLKFNAKRIVYVSCNPSTLAKDLNLLYKKYKIKYIQPIDMFPYTAHIENVVLLEIITD